MPRIARLLLLAVSVASVAVTGSALSAEPQPGPAVMGPSGLPLPRFVSLKSGRVNLRVGPGRAYPVEWMYLKPGLPMEIIQEYDTWRRVRDAEGAEGWVSQALLSGKRTAIVAPWQRGKDALVAIHATPDDTGPSVASVEPGAVGTIKECDGAWCEMSFEGARGFVRQTQLRGAYPNEKVDD